MTVQELAPYRKRVALRMKKNADSRAWPILKDRWQAIVQGVREQEAAYEAGAPFARHQREALHEVLKVAANVSAEDLIEVSLAMYLLQEDRPQRFKSDKAFDAQLARRIRGLTDTNAGSYWDNERKRVKKVYREVPPRVLAAFAASIKEAFGLAGLHVAVLEQQEAFAKANQEVALVDALGSLK